MMTSYFTGHRKLLCDIEDLKERLYNVLKRAINKAGITEFYNGGAIGFDLLADQTVLKLRKSYLKVKLHMILPCSSEEQSKDWSDEQKTAYFGVLE